MQHDQGPWRGGGGGGVYGQNDCYGVAAFRIPVNFDMHDHVLKKLILTF